MKFFTVLALLVVTQLTACDGSSNNELTGEFSTSTVPGETNPENSFPTPSPVDDDAVLPRFDIGENGTYHAYRKNAPYASVIVECSTEFDWTETCSLHKLPFLGQQYETVGVEQIMERLVVSHDWMGVRFEQLLADAPHYVLQLFRSVTAIKIHSRHRYSNYMSRHGAITIDPNYLWHTVDEKQNIFYLPGQPSDKQLQFTFVHGWRIEGKNLDPIPSLINYRERTPQEVRYPFYRVLIHELAHASDYLPHNAIPLLNSDLLPLNALNELYTHRIFRHLYADDYGLKSDTLRRIGDVLYRHRTPTDEQSAMDPYFIGSEMANDGAIYMYGYKSWLEDVATLFTAAMMNVLFNAQKYSAVTTRPENLENLSCEDLTVVWGTYDRVLDPLVLPRAKYVVEKMFPFHEYQQVINALDNIEPRDELMLLGENWCINKQM